MSQPLILTLRLDTTSEKLLTSLRTRFFPPSLNHLSAHLTLFHALPASALPHYTSLLTAMAARERVFTVGLNAPFLLGGKRSTGVAIHVASSRLRKLHQELLGELGRGRLTGQDQRPLRPHVTVQNKVGEGEARRTMEVLRRDWQGREGRAEGFSLWRYELDGRWSFVRDFDFGSES